MLVFLAWSGSFFEHSSGVTVGAGGVKRRFPAGSGAAFTNGVRTGQFFCFWCCLVKLFDTCFTAHIIPHKCCHVLDVVGYQ